MVQGTMNTNSYAGYQYRPKTLASDLRYQTSSPQLAISITPYVFHAIARYVRFVVIHLESETDLSSSHNSSLIDQHPAKIQNELGEELPNLYLA